MINLGQPVVGGEISDLGKALPETAAFSHRGLNPMFCDWWGNSLV